MCHGRVGRVLLRSLRSFPAACRRHVFSTIVTDYCHFVLKFNYKLLIFAISSRQNIVAGDEVIDYKERVYKVIFLNTRRAGLIVPRIDFKRSIKK